MTQSEQIEIFRFLIQERGYVVLRFDWPAPAGSVFTRFSNGVPLPQPFAVLSETDKSDWREQRRLTAKRFNFKWKVVPNPGKFFRRCLTD